jgi:hypothetical protein
MIFLQADGASLISINSLEEHEFVVNWLDDNDKQGLVNTTGSCAGIFFNILQGGVVDEWPQGLRNNRSVLLGE